MKKMFEEATQLAQTMIDDEQRLRFHIQPPIGLLNDPNGLVQFNGEYHVFYQWNPWGCEHKNKAWGHLTTKNFITFHQHDVALLPTDSYDKNGCYSGSGFVKDGAVHLIYTGNVKDENGNRESYQCLARVDSTQGVEKLGVVIDNLEIPQGYTRHFRDPKIWYDEHTHQWVTIFGVQTVDEKGTALLYTSPDARTWTCLGELQTTYTRNFGYMWECPDLLHVDGTDVFIFSPQGLSQQGMEYANIYQSGYLLGAFDLATQQMTHTPFVELDRGFEFYAPQTMLDEQGRTIMIGWMGLPEEEDQPTCVNGWVHALTLPRQLNVIDGSLHQQPLKELQSLRREVDVQHKKMQIEEKQLFSVDVTYELQLQIPTTTQTGVFAIEFGEHHRFEINFDTQVATLTRGGEYLPGIRQCQLQLEDTLSMTLYKDTSSVEIFLQDGKEVFTARTFHKQDGKLTIESSQIIQMDMTYWPLEAIEIKK